MLYIWSHWQNVLTPSDIRHNKVLRYLVDNAIYRDISNPAMDLLA